VTAITMTWIFKAQICNGDEFVGNEATNAGAEVVAIPAFADLVAVRLVAVLERIARISKL
jgi:hypothetical protein